LRQPNHDIAAEPAGYLDNARSSVAGEVVTNLAGIGTPQQIWRAIED